MQFQIHAAIKPTVPTQVSKLDWDFFISLAAGVPAPAATLD